MRFTFSSFHSSDQTQRNVAGCALVRKTSYVPLFYRNAVKGYIFKVVEKYKGALLNYF